MRRKGLALLSLLALGGLCACETKGSSKSSPTVGGSLAASEPPPRMDPTMAAQAYAIGGGGDAGDGGASGGVAEDQGRSLFDGDNRGLKDAPGAVSVPGGAGPKKVALTADGRPDTLKINEPPASDVFKGPFRLGDLSDPVPHNPLERVFYHYAACFGMDWRFLKTVAEAESGLDPRNGLGKKYVGLFQVDSSGGKDSCSEYAKPFGSFLDCNKLEDPEVNTALSAHRFDRYFTGQMNFTGDPAFPPLNKACPRASVEALAALAYVGHNNGPGVLGHIMRRIKANKACRLENQEAAVRDFYRDPEIGNDGGFYEIPKAGETPRPCPNQEELKGKWSFHCISEDYGVKKWQYGVRRIAKPLKKAGIAKLYPEGVKDPALCPAQRQPPGRLTAADLSKAE